MTYEDNYQVALKKLKHDMSNNDTLKDNIERITNCREKVLKKFHDRVFSPENIPNLSTEDFKSFFLFSNNCHWRGIHRSRNIISKDMKKLRRDLLYLLDQTKPIDKRVNYIFKNTPGMGKATTTPVLLIAYPNE